MGNFIPRLDRRDIPYLITDEKIQTSNGVGEAFLLHDNVKKESIEIWTKESGKGVKITSYTIDTPEMYKWRTKLTVFTKEPIVYVTYATFGDQVEAEDINGLQNAVTEIDKKFSDHTKIPHGDMFINVYDSDLDGVVERADVADSVDWSGVRNKPTTYAPSTHTHTEAEIVGLNKYTKQEVDTKLGVKADKADVSAHTNNGDMHVTASEKVSWTSKAAGVHTHTIPEIVGLQAVLDAKETPSGAQLKADKALEQAKTYAESKVSELVANAPATLDTLYELSAALGNDPNFATTVAKSISEKETPAGAQAKVNTHATRSDNPHAVNKAQVGLGNVSNVLQASKAEFDSHLAESSSLAAKGHVQLSDSTTSTSTNLAATANAVRKAYEKAEQAFTQVSNGKQLIAAAITDRNLPTSGGDTFEVMANNIRLLGNFELPKDDTSGSPGSPYLFAGDMQAGYFGTVPASELWTGSQLASDVGITTGLLQHSDTDWLKFVYEGKILFRPMKAIRRGISWDSINVAGCVFGTKTITKSGLTYKVRLMKGATKDLTGGDFSGPVNRLSEWNKLMLPIHLNAKDKSWNSPYNVETDVPYWGIDFTDNDLLTHYNYGDGVRSWCQETVDSNSKLFRGGSGVSYSFREATSYSNNLYGWAPVLELIQ